MESAKGAGETLDSAQTFINEWNGRNRRIGVGFGPHAPYSCSESLFREVVHRAKNIGVRIHTHLAETRFEVDFIKNREGISPVEWLDKLGLLGPWCWIAHGVHLNSEEIALLSKRRVAVAYNPTSNMKLASGIPPIIKMLRQGICVALGTDSNLSNNNLDMFEEMRVGAGLQKLASMDASAISCDQILRMATRNGACALGMESEIGSLEVGKKADVIILDCESPHMWPLLSGEIFNVPEQIVYSANAADVATTIVDGKILMLDRKVTTLDEKSVRSEVERAILTLITKAGVGKFLKKRHPPSGMFHGKG
jgi:5-methylthioadenosine/S-adenosylhomocysteine deaminase